MVKGPKATIKTNVFIIQEIGWEYTDEYYYRPESRGGVPKIMYTDKAKAEKVCKELNQAKVKETKEWQMADQNDKPIKDFYEVVEVEVG